MDMNKISISYCICTWNEHVELDLLLKRLIPNLQDVDEIVIQGDQGKVTDEVISVVRGAMKDPRIKYLEFPLKKNFANFKNNAIKNCSGEYIFLIDPDEIPHPRMLANLKYLLFENPDVDMFQVPRVNIVLGLTKEYIKEQRWFVNKIQIPKLDYDSKGILALYGIKENNAIEGKLEIQVVNFYDPQLRIFKNNGKILYESERTVHEKLVGYRVWTRLPHKKELFDEFDFDWSLFHVKKLDRQINQNKFYETF